MPLWPLSRLGQLQRPWRCNLAADSIGRFVAQWHPTALLLRLPDSTEDGIGFEGKLDAIAIGSALRKAPPPQSKALAHEPHTPEARVATECAEWVSLATETRSCCNRVGLCCNRAGLRCN